jgi:hypothetical protein
MSRERILQTRVWELEALLEVAYDGLLNHHLHDDQERDDFTNKVGAGLTDRQRRRVAFSNG